MKSILFFVACLLSTCIIRAQSDCESALPVSTGVYQMPGFTVSEVPVGVCVGGATQFAWYTYTPVEDTYTTVTTDLFQNFGGDTRLSVYVGTCGATSCIGFDDDSGDGFLSTFSWNTTAGVTYYIVFDDFWVNAGFWFEITEGEPVENLVDFVPEIIEVQGSALCVVDMNADFLDDIVCENGNSLHIRYQQEDGSYIPQDFLVGDIAYPPYWSLAAGDIDNNGYTDLVYAGSGASFIWANDDGTGYSETHVTQYIFCQRSNMVDINGDGNLDAFVCHDVEPNTFFINDGAGTMSYNQGGMGDTFDGGNYGSVWLDYDNDCDPDLFIAKCRGGESLAKYNQLLRNDGNGVFTEVSEESGLWDPLQTWSSACADFDNDGDMDIMVCASSFSDGHHKLMKNNGDGTFTDVTEGSGIENHNGTSIENYPADFNNDGWVDVFGLGNNLLINSGNMTFTVSNVTATFGPFGDLNNDGFIDVVSNSFDGNATVHINQGNDNNWLTVNTVGTASNKSGIGARVTIHTASGQQIRDVRSGEGFSYMQSLNTHFGIGTDTEIELITVCWPSGIFDQIENPDINQALTIVEGSHVISVEEQETELNIYPNPTSGLVRIQTNSSLPVTGIVIYDLSGKVVLDQKMFNGQIDVSQLAPGLYTVKTVVAGKLLQSKLTIQ